MKWKTGPTGLTGLILFLLMNTATGPEQGDECKKTKLICPKSHEAAVGKAVTLDCHVEYQCDVQDQSIVWKFNNNDQVLVYKTRSFSPDDQADRFKGRASEDSSWKPTKGELAVKISPVKITDAGTYNCSVGTGSSKRSCSTKLNIKQQVEEKGKEGEQAQGTTASLPKQSEGDPTKSPRLQDNKDTVTGIGAGFGTLIGIGALIVIGFGIYKCMSDKKAKKEPAPEPQNDPSIGTSPRCTEDRGYTRQRSKETDNPVEIPLMNKGSTSDTSDGAQLS